MLWGRPGPTSGRPANVYVSDALRIAGELKSGAADGATLDELLERIKAQLTKLGPILEVEVVREPEGSRTEGSVALAN
jgi:hypothetical protein